MSTRAESIVIAGLVLGLGYLAYQGAYDVSDELPDLPEPEGEESATAEPETPVGQFVLPDVEDAPELEARSLSKGLYADRGEWRGRGYMADLDRDGNLDLVGSIRRWSPSEPADGLFVWLGDGAGNWTEAVDGIRRDMGYGGAAAADIDGDGYLDIGFSAHDTTPQAFLNRLETSGGWEASSHGLVMSVDGVSSDVGMGDVDGDGKADYLVLGMFPEAGGLFYFQGDGEGSFELAEELLPSSEYGSAVEVVDLDGDGRGEVLAATSTGPRVWSYQDGAFEDWSAGLPVREEYQGEQMGYIMGSDLAVDATDLDGDGFAELLLAGMVYPDHPSMRLYRRVELEGQGGVWQEWGEGIPRDGEAYFDARFGQIDGRGPLEIVAAGRVGINVISMVEPGVFERTGRVKDTGGVFNVATGDANGDGYDEIVFVGYGGIRVLDLNGLRRGEE